MAIEFLDSPFFTSQSDDGFLENIKQGDYPGYLQNLGEGLRDEFLGIDDYTRAAKYAAQGNFLKAAKSFLAGNLELGSSALMFVPGANILALAAKGGKLGKLGKALKFLAPLSKEEQVVARAARARGLRPGFFSAPTPGAMPSDLIGKSIQLPLFNTAPSRFSRLAAKIPAPARRVTAPIGRTVKRFKPQEIGMSRGGYAGSLVRGTSQFLGATPSSQGPLASRAYLARSGGQTPSFFARTGERMSGKLSVPLAREGRDELTQLLPGVGGGAYQMTPQEQAIWEAIQMAQLYSPGAAY